MTNYGGKGNCKKLIIVYQLESKKEFQTGSFYLSSFLDFEWAVFNSERINQMFSISAVSKSMEWLVYIKILRENRFYTEGVISAEKIKVDTYYWYLKEEGRQPMRRLKVYSRQLTSPIFTGTVFALAKYIIGYFYPATIMARAGLRIENL